MIHSLRRSTTICILVISILVSGAQVPGQQRIRHSAAANATKTRPRLVLLIVVDQFRYDYLQRFGDLFGPHGIKRLMSDGAFWTNAKWNYTPTKTAPGHAAMLTGAPPAGTGMVGNEWIDRQTAKKITSVTDDSARVLGGGPKESAYSPHLLEASTLGDELRVATNDRAKVFGISGKPRAAILPAGRHANAAYWLSSDIGNVISSDYYFPRLPDWVLEFNRTRPLDKYFGARWERLLPEAEYLKRAGADSPPWENIDKAPGETNAFPHIITGGARGPGTDFYDALDHSPFVNDVLVSFAEQLIPREQLGQDDVTDLLSISLSGNDHVGHRFGPYSQEVMDITLRVDRQIASLLDFVDAQVGLENTLVIFTSDHGVAPLWDQSAARGLGQTRIGHAEVLKAIRSAISARYYRPGTPTKSEMSARSMKSGPSGASPNLTVTDIPDYIMKYDDDGVTKDGVINGNLYFNLAALERDGIRLDEIEEVAGQAALKVPGIARYFTRAQFDRCSKGRTNIPVCPGCAVSNDRLEASTARRSLKPKSCTALNDPIARSVMRGFYPSRSGDVVILQEPFRYFGDSTDPANHGSPYSYDTHVPMIIMGAGFRAGRYRQAASPTDIAATLAAVLQINPPNKSQGRVLIESLFGAGSRSRRQEQVR